MPRVPVDQRARLGEDRRFAARQERRQRARIQRLDGPRGCDVGTGRGVWSVLNHLKLTELGARDVDEYIRIAAELAGDLSRLRGMRASMRTRMSQSALVDQNRFARNLEAAYRELWQRWCASR